MIMVKCPNAHRMSNIEFITMPLHMHLTKDDVKMIANKVIEPLECINMEIIDELVEKYGITEWGKLPIWKV